jgi:hypothetical protein
LVPIKGKVTLDGQPLADANVSFAVPDGKNPTGFTSASGMTDSSGLYQAKTGDKYGVPPGRYRIAVSKWATPNGQPFKADPANGLDEIQAQMSGAMKQMVPEKYADVQNQLTVEIAPDRKDPVDVELKSK